MNVDLVKAYRFEAAHTTPSDSGKGRLHGHSYRVDIVVSGACDAELGWLMDYAEIGERFDELYKSLDHRLLDGVPGLEATSLPAVREWLVERLSAKLELLKDVHVSIVGDLAFKPIRLDPSEVLGLPTRVQFGFEAAHALPRLPETHKCRRMHGHSFQVHVGAEDLERLIPSLQRVYDRLDHTCLNEIEGLENPTSEEVSRWIWQALAPAAPGLSVVVVAETCTARCIYHGP